MDWKEIFTNDISDKRTVIWNMRRTLKRDYNKRNDPIKKWAEVWPDAQPKKIYRRHEKQMQRCSASFLVRDVDIETQRHHCTSTVTSSIKSSRHQTLARTQRSWWRREEVQPRGAAGRRLAEQNTVSPCDPATGLLHTHSADSKAHVRTKTRMWLRIAALFIVDESWKPPRRPSRGDWTNWYPPPPRSRILLGNESKWAAELRTGQWWL